MESIIGQEGGWESRFGRGNGNISARRLKRSVKRRMYEFPRAVIRQGPKIVNTNGNARAT